MTQINLSQLNPSLLEKLKTLAQKHNRSIEKEIENILEDQVQELEMTQSGMVETPNQREKNHNQHSEQVSSVEEGLISDLTQSSVKDEGGFGCARGLIVIPSDFDELLEDFSEYV